MKSFMRNSKGDLMLPNGVHRSPHTSNEALSSFASHWNKSKCLDNKIIMSIMDMYCINIIDSHGYLTGQVWGLLRMPNFCNSKSKIRKPTYMFLKSNLFYLHL